MLPGFRGWGRWWRGGGGGGGGAGHGGPRGDALAHPNTPPYPSSMRTKALAALPLLATLPLLAADAPQDPRRDFDFWCGKWSIQNERLLQDGSKKTGPATLSVRPVLGGMAILEESWSGAPDSDMADTFGMSLRFYDEDLQRWVVILAWPSGAPTTPSFGRMEGAFTSTDTGPQCILRPPAAFDAPGIEPAKTDTTHFIFSDPTPTSCKWTLVVPWQEKMLPVWEMNFTRTAPAVHADEPIDINPVPETCACEQPEARDLDWLIGRWTDSLDPARPRITVRASSANRGCTILLTVSEENKDARTQHRVALLSYIPNANAWHIRSVDSLAQYAAWEANWNPNFKALLATAGGDSDPERQGDQLLISRMRDGRLEFAIRNKDNRSTIHAKLTRDPDALPEN